MQDVISKLREENEMLLDALKEITEMAEKWSAKGLTPTIFKAQQAIERVSKPVLSEKELVVIAENDIDDQKANEAMKELRKRFDQTYGWCMYCDGLVTKEQDCCMNRH